MGIGAVVIVAVVAFVIFWPKYQKKKAEMVREISIQQDGARIDAIKATLVEQIGLIRQRMNAEPNPEIKAQYAKTIAAYQEELRKTGLSDHFPEAMK